MIVVERPGMMTTVQDLGRYGYQAQGVPTGGAVDRFALAVANLLVGNPADAAGLECTVAGPILQFEKNCLVAVTGARVEHTPMGQPFTVRAGGRLRLDRIRTGCRAYVAVAGGIDVPVVMGSRSTYVRAGFGGFKGRALKAHDQLPVGRPVRRVRPGGWGLGPSVTPVLSREPVVRVLRGPQWDGFEADAWATLTTAIFRISPQSDRMGLRLEGPALVRRDSRELDSEAVALGTIQVPADGKPIVLLADRQTLGGYPKIATVFGVDISVLAQLRPGDPVRFVEVELAEAERLRHAQARELAILEAGIRVRFPEAHA